MNVSPQFEKRWYVLVIMCIVLFIISIDNTVLNLALPSISAGLGATASQLQWIVDSYTLIFASLLITTGSIGDRYGRKKLLLIGLTLFGLGSLGAALSVSTGMLIVFRLLLGVAGALVMPSTLSILIDVFRDGRERAKAIAIWSSIFSIGAGIGPIIGGFLINSFSWAACVLSEYSHCAGLSGGWFHIRTRIKEYQRPEAGLAGGVIIHYWVIIPGFWHDSSRRKKLDVSHGFTLFWDCFYIPVRFYLVGESLQQPHAATVFL